MYSKKIKLIFLICSFIFLIIGFIYMKNRDFNYVLIGLRIEDENIPPVDSVDYPWEFKTICYDRNDFSELSDFSYKMDDAKIPYKLLEEATEPIFFNFVPIINSKKGEFKIQSIGISEKNKVEELIKDKKVEVSADNYTIDSLFYNPIKFIRLGTAPDVSIGNDRGCRVTYVLDKRYNIWFPCFVSFQQANEVFIGSYSIINYTATKNFSYFFAEKGTNNILQLREKNTEEEYEKIKNGIFEPTDGEKEMAKEAFIKYKGKKTILDDNQDGDKYLIWVNNGKRILSVENKFPQFPLLGFNVTSHIIGLIIFYLVIFIILFPPVFFYIKRRHFDYRLIGKKGNFSENLDNFKINNALEYKTMINVFYSNAKKNSRNENILKIKLRMLFYGSKEPIFLNFVTSKKFRKEKMIIEPLYLSEKDKLQELIKNKKIEALNLDLTKDPIESLFFCFDKENYLDSSIAINMVRSTIYRVTYILDKTFNILVPCLVTCYEMKKLNCITSLKLKSNDEKVINVNFNNYTQSNNFKNELVEFETGKKSTFRLPLTKEDFNLIKEKFYEPTIEEKELSKKVYIKYKGRKCLYDRIPDSMKYTVLVEEGGLELLKIKCDKVKFHLIKTNIFYE